MLSVDYKGFIISPPKQLAEQLSIYNVFGLIPKDTFDDMKPFKKARLVKSKAAKGNYILYYVWDVQKNNLVRKRLFTPKKYKSEAEQLAFAKERIQQINSLLVDGFHIDRKKTNAKIQNEKQSISPVIYSIREAVRAFIKLKKLKNSINVGSRFMKIP